MIDQLIRQFLSPDQVSGYLKEHPNVMMSHETIYRYIYQDKARHEELKPFYGRVKSIDVSATVPVIEPPKYLTEPVFLTTQ